MKAYKSTLLILILTILTVNFSVAQQKVSTKKLKKETTMKTYVIEREIPNAGLLTMEDLKGISQKSCKVLDEMGPKIEWLHSYVTENKLYCIYKAESKKVIQEHASKGGFPTNSISELSTIISPKTAEN